MHMAHETAICRNTHNTVRQTENPALQDSLVTNTRSVKILCPQNITCPYIFLKTSTCLSVGLLLTLRRLMSYIYGAPILDVSRSHTTTQHSR